MELCKLAIDYSDGIVEASETVNNELLSYAEQRSCPILRYPGKEDFGLKYKDFYQQLLPTV
jgi:starch synthase